jgi:6-phosphogluconate dehydrogenase (decarboxylating)
MMIDSGNKYYKLNMETVEEFEKHGVSELDLDILVLDALENELA